MPQYKHGPGLPLINDDASTIFPLENQKWEPSRATATTSPKKETGSNGPKKQR